MDKIELPAFVAIKPDYQKRTLDVVMTFVHEETAITYLEGQYEDRMVYKKWTPTTKFQALKDAILAFFK